MNLKSTSGLTVEFLETGAVKSINAGDIRISLKAASLFSEPGANIYLRKRSKTITYTPLTGPNSPGVFSLEPAMASWQGEWQGIGFTCRLSLSASEMQWQWNIILKNDTAEEVSLDLVYQQDVGLKPVNAGLQNEYYVSQYLERLILQDDRYGKVICLRQNMREATGHPWFMIACQNDALAGSTDGMQFYGKTYRETGVPEGLLDDTLQGEYAGESPVIALQAKPFKLASGEEKGITYTGIYTANHPGATTIEDLKRLSVGEMESRFSGTPSQSHRDSISVQPGLHLGQTGTPAPGTPALNFFSQHPSLPVDDLTPEELVLFFGNSFRHQEEHHGKLLSYFNDSGNHIVLRAKEILADRPHAHIMQALTSLVPDENIMSTTAFMFGVFNSHITQGNTNFNTLLSVCTSQFNQARESGQRIFVEIEEKIYLLGVPSAFEMGLNHCRWIYKHGYHCFQVRTWTSKRTPQVNLDFRVISGDDVKLILTHDFDPLNKWKIFPGVTSDRYFALPEEETMIKSRFPNARFRFTIHGDTQFRAGGDEMLFGDNKRHGSSLFVLSTEQTGHFFMSITGEVCRQMEDVHITDADSQFAQDCTDARNDWATLSLNLDIRSNQNDIAAIREILPWYGMNALTHFLTPYGLEQFSGAAWGTRDVSQGPIDLLLTLGKYEEAKQVLRTIFSNQETTGGWPQWWMFDSYSNIRSDSSHDDIYYWCLIALADYIKTTGDEAFLDEVLPYYHENRPGSTDKKPLSEHVDRLINMIIASFIPGTSLVPFGGGDWNDSLQPVSKDLARRMISSWTVEMNYQAFMQYQVVYKITGHHDMANRLNDICMRIKSDFNKYLVKDGIVAGYGLTEEDGSISVMLHPSDLRTGVHYSILPMERGILSGIFSKEQARHHQELIEKYLKGPDGARLMDKPLKYKGGIQEIFQRAESSTFFGREIGLMYIHEHIRYAESLAITGQAEAFVRALRQAIPVAYRDIVPNGDIRQSNCYYSSSDVHFKNRYEADERYQEVIDGKFTLRGGWRVYSSGPGIYTGIVIKYLLGLRAEAGNVILDPVIPYEMDGLEANIIFVGNNVTFRYKVKEGNFSPKAILINGVKVDFTHQENEYRRGGAVIKKTRFNELLNEKENIVIISL